MLSHLFLGMSLIGAEWVLYLLLLLSVLSVSLMFERAKFYRDASRGLEEFRARVRETAGTGRVSEALAAAQARTRNQATDLESGLAAAVLTQGPASATVLSELAQDAVMRAKIGWDRNLAMLATIGSNAPFVGLFGTVLGIIKAFHDLSTQAPGGAGAQAVTAGISESLVATAIGILVAIPAVVAFNLFQRRVKTAMAEAEALKSFLVGKLASGGK